MYYAYVLKPESGRRLYKGSCENIELRLKLHNAGKVKSTKPYRPWVLVYHEEFATRSEAFGREQYWKTAKGARALKRLILSE